MGGKTSCVAIEINKCSLDIHQGNAWTCSLLKIDIRTVN